MSDIQRKIPMTRDEILAMDPGRELDALVGKHVMLLDIVEDRLLSHLPKYYLPEYERTIFTDVPHYSTNISAAWEVLGKFYYVDIRKVNKVDEDRRWKWVAYVSRGDGYSHNATADTAPEAICKAALLALEESQ